MMCRLKASEGMSAVMAVSWPKDKRHRHLRTKCRVHHLISQLQQTRCLACEGWDAPLYIFLRKLAEMVEITVGCGQHSDVCCVHSMLEVPCMVLSTWQVKGSFPGSVMQTQASCNDCEMGSCADGWKTGMSCAV